MSLTSRTCKGCGASFPKLPITNDKHCALQCPDCGDVSWLCMHCPYTVHLKSNIDISRRNHSPQSIFNKHYNRSLSCGASKRVEINEMCKEDAAAAADDAFCTDEICEEEDASGDDDVFCTNEIGEEDEDAADNAFCIEEIGDDEDAADDLNEVADDDSEISNHSWKVPSDEDHFDPLVIETQRREQVEILNQESKAFALETLIDDLSKDDLIPTMIETKADKSFDLNSYSFMDLRNDNEKRKRKNGGSISVSQNQLYFAQKAHSKNQDESDHLGGFRGLVFRACGKDREHVHGMVSNLEGEVALLLTMLILDLGKKDNHRLIMYDTKKSDLTGYSDRAAGYMKFPRSCAEARNLIIDGHHSILKNFPTPKVFVIDNHACVSLKEAFLLAAAHRGDFQFAWDGRTKTANKDGLNGTRATADLLREINEKLKKEGYSDKDIKEFNIGHLLFWSDSFLVSFVKQKDNSVWLLTVTISAPFGHMNTQKYTYVLAMGRSSEDHSKVVAHFRKEATELMSGFRVYYGHSNEIRNTAVGLLFHLGDRPEKQSIMVTRKEGHFGKFSNWSVCINERYFPACRQCYKNITKQILESTPMPSQKCGRCQCWSIDPKEDPRWYCSVTGTDYPTTELECPNTKAPEGRKPGVTHIGAVRLTAQFLRLACNYAYKARFHGVWTVGNMKEYLRTCNINQHCIDHISDQVEDDRKNKRESPLDSFLPQIWLGATSYEDPFWFCNFPDLPLHAIAHGMIPDVMDAVHQILAHWKKFTDYVNSTNAIINDIAEMRLDWCKIKSLPKAAWVGENTMAYMRLMSYLYGRYFENKKFGQEKERTIQNVMRLVHALQATLSLLMSMEKPISGQIKSLLMLTLSTAHYLHSGYGSLSPRDEDANKKTSSTKRFVDGIHLGDVMELLKILDIDGGTTENTCRSALHNINKGDLVEYVETHKLMDDIKLIKRQSKLELQKKVFNNVLGRPLRQQSRQGKEKSQPIETMIWNKGAWLSLVTNLDDQVDYMGVIQLYW